MQHKNRIVFFNFAEPRSVSSSAPLTQHLTCIVSVIILLLEYSAMNSVYKNTVILCDNNGVVLRKTAFEHWTHPPRCPDLTSHWHPINMKPAVAFLYCTCLNSYVWQSWLKDVYIYKYIYPCSFYLGCFLFVSFFLNTFSRNQLLLSGRGLDWCSGSTLTGH